ncbi:MAG: hypothetical protein IPL53_06500 [Ignavibacteria bacterium]|nr:hypothetical protein [Ignavibacteria bacterium]
MKPFFIKLFKFSVFAVTAILCLYALTTALYIYKLNTIKLGDNINTLILGDSQTQTAVNDSIFTNSINYSHNSEHYLITYNVLKLVVSNNPQIRNVVLGFSFHNTSTFYDRCLFNEGNKAEGISRMLCSRYFTMLDNSNKLMLIENNLPVVLKTLRPGVLDMMESLVYNYSNYQDYRFIGRYYPGIKRILNDSVVKESILWHFYTDSTGIEMENFSDLQSEYLKKIISFCKERNIKVYLLNTPVHQDYYKQIPQEFISRYYSYIKDLEENYNVTLLDYPDCKFPDEYFGDGNHLNRLGASVFTPMVMSRIE